MPEMKKAPPVAAGEAQEEETMPTHFSARSTATEAQIQRLLAKLRQRPHHTHELRRDGISHPAGRILDLRKRGFEIFASRVTTVDSDAFTHVGVARYELVFDPEVKQ